MFFIVAWKMANAACDKLKNKPFLPIRWTVPLYIPEGMTVFAGKPKIGNVGASLRPGYALPA